MAERVCDICGVVFDTKNNGKRCSDNCKKEWRRRYALEYYYDNRDLLLSRNKQYRDATPERQLLKGASWRSIVNNMDFNLIEDDILIPEICPILKIKLDSSGRHGPTLDRRDPNKGYVKGNVWVISKLANLMKSDSTLEEQRKFAEWVKTL